MLLFIHCRCAQTLLLGPTEHVLEVGLSRSLKVVIGNILVFTKGLLVVVIKATKCCSIDAMVGEGCSFLQEKT